MDMTLEVALEANMSNVLEPLGERDLPNTNVALIHPT